MEHNFKFDLAFMQGVKTPVTINVGEYVLLKKGEIEIWVLYKGRVRTKEKTDLKLYGLYMGHSMVNFLGYATVINGDKIHFNYDNVFKVRKTMPLVRWFNLLKSVKV